MGTPTLATAQWTALWRLSQQGPLAVAPVRISLGLPRFWGEAKHTRGASTRLALTGSPPA